MLNTFKDFLDDVEAKHMYITGRAGTGKTTELAVLVLYCLQNDIECIISAHTHKALGILASKMPPSAILQTLHSFLGKRPITNPDATSSSALEISAKVKESALTTVIFVDEYSQVGLRDAEDMPDIKRVWLGDPYQLGPVNDKAGVIPEGDYQVILDKVWRQGEDNPLSDVIEQIVGFIEGKPMTPILANSRYIRGQNLVEAYSQCANTDKVLLCFTNKSVQNYNTDIQGYCEPRIGDKLFSGTTQRHYTFRGWVTDPDYINTPWDSEVLALGSKYRELEHLFTLNCRFAELEDEEGDLLIHAIEFGTYSYKCYLDDYKEAAAASNSAITDAYYQVKANSWARNNPKTPLAMKRKRAWRDYLTAKNNVLCLDFTHAMTVHKSQGSTFKYVFIDMEDLHIASHFGLQTYLQLVYVGTSRASYMVITN
ncbi:MAG: ATP-dependent helicase [Pseudoalteromonas sp.]|uniref:ATP-dependent helicase n=1 Tax=Pseudoalteromonas sp. TaxID=53249 RepID=UPI001D451FA1|nr:ATP-dependent helicase [Pseudoalteromonas sp.]NRA77909.1 ATP-dependent helicase [Pseudoalteromonas sp.]